ncbi:hypothetical protein K492DRAFT_86957 [Lichtheimia hyalospora FSU 10163]|nr:hypothetical protein K492DRAFT_86957 [Lichtheimia hyalospora FSU 10163]
MAAENKKALVYSILEFLKKSCDDGTIGQDDVEGIEVAMQCIGEAFSVDPTDPAQQEAYSTKPANLLNIFEIYLKTKAKSRGAQPTDTAATSASSSSAPAPSASVSINALYPFNIP